MVANKWLISENGLPPATTVARIGPAIAAALGGIVAGLSYESLRRKEPTFEEQRLRSREVKRRAERLQEILRVLENTEGDLRIRQTNDDMEENAEETSCQIRFDTLLQRCRELEQLVPEGEVADLLVDGFSWATHILIKELRVATVKTRAGASIEYSDGSKLDNLLKKPKTLQRVALRAGHPIPRMLFDKLHEAAAKGQTVRTAIRRIGIKKAFLLLLRARATWPWVAANSLVAVTSGVAGAVALDYQAQLFESFRTGEKNARRRFRSVALAWIAIEVCEAFLGVIMTQLSERGEKTASRLLQVQLFRAVARQELRWWEAKADADVHSYETLIRWRMPHEVGKVLNIPRDFLSRFASIVAALWRMKHQSNSIMMWMIGIHWLHMLAQKGVRWFREMLQQWCYRGIVTPSQDDATYRYAIRPEFAALYQSFVRAPKETKLFEQAVQQTQSYDQRMVAVSHIIEPVLMCLKHTSTVSQFAAVGNILENGHVGEGQARTMMHHAADVSQKIQSTYNDWVHAQDKCAELAKAYDLITIAPEIDPDGGEVPNTQAHGHIVFKNVEFKYPSRKGSTVLKGTSFEVLPGQVVGIVGETGCGKSTVFRLLQRFYDVDAGSISLDGYDIRDLNPEWLRTQISTVSQEPEMIPLTIRDNICIGCPHDPSAKEIQDACKAANVWESLADKAKFPEGLQTRIRAVKNVAGGEKQRICIARAILANTPILLLDEATSALDKVTEVMVQDALENLMEGRTTLVIAHRLSTLRNVDLILGMKDGVITEVGSHDELVLKPLDDATTVYGRLWHEQSGTVPDSSISGGALASSNGEGRRNRRTRTAVSSKDNGVDSVANLADRLGKLKGLLAEGGSNTDVEQARADSLRAIHEFETDYLAPATSSTKLDEARVIPAAIPNSPRSIGASVQHEATKMFKKAQNEQTAPVPGPQAVLEPKPVPP